MHDGAELRCRAGSDCTVERNFAAEPASTAGLKRAGLRRVLSVMRNEQLIARGISSPEVERELREREVAGATDPEGRGRI